MENREHFVNNEIFWDIIIKKLDFNENSLFIAERVLTKGAKDDEVALYRYYSFDKVVDKMIINTILCIEN